jgi:pimeloyl-ACP methyl ester carboxylesterase
VSARSPLETIDSYAPTMSRAIHSVVLANGLNMPYVEQGDPDAIPVMLLHGWGESLGSFDRLLSELPSSLHVLAMDQRGHGGADKPHTGYSLADYAGDVDNFMDVTGLESAILVGSSSGGYVAQQVAVVSPRRVTGLVLVGSPRSLHRRPAFADEVEALTDPIDPAWVQESLKWFPRFHEVPGWYIEDRVADGVRMPARVWRASLEGLSTARPPTESGTITAPTLIIWGARDELLRREEQDALAAAIPKSRLVVFEETGHLVLWEQPGRVAQDIVSFILSLSPPPSGV